MNLFFHSGILSSSVVAGTGAGEEVVSITAGSGSGTVAGVEAGLVVSGSGTGEDDGASEDSASISASASTSVSLGSAAKAGASVDGGFQLVRVGIGIRMVLVLDGEERYPGNRR